MIGILVKGKAPFVPNEKIQYRSLKNFNEKDFNADLQNIPFHISYVFDDPDDVYWAHEYLFKEVVAQHALMKERRSKTNKPPLMNCELRRAVYVKRMLKNKYMEDIFWTLSWWTKVQGLLAHHETFLIKKGSKDDPSILLNENGKIISDQKEVCDVLMTFCQCCKRYLIQLW